MTKKKNQKGAGRKTVMTDLTLSKLKEGFAQGFSVNNACIWADISQSTYFEYCKKNPQFSEHCKSLQKKPLIKSILVINKSLNDGDVSTAKWYAERKGKEEFSLRVENTGKDGKDMAVDVIIKDNIQPKPNKSDTGGIQYKGGIK